MIFFFFFVFLFCIFSEIPQKKKTSSPSRTKVFPTGLKLPYNRLGMYITTGISTIREIASKK